MLLPTHRVWLIFIFLLSLLGTGCGSDDSSFVNGPNLVPVVVTSPSPGGTDTTAPTVTLTDPAGGASGVPLNKKISIAFSEGLDPVSVNAATFLLRGPGNTPVAGTVSYSGFVATFTPASPLTASTVYTATVTTGVRDLAGNALATDYSWNFGSGLTLDSAPPAVTFTDPINGATGVAINKKIAVAFNEGMDPLTLNAGSFTLAGPGNVPVAGTVTYVGLTATFSPLANLASNTLYTATVNSGARDLAGNALAPPFVWSFTTGGAPDTTAPTVTFTDPINGATGVATNKKVAATFSKPMDPVTINTATFTLTAPGNTPVAGTVTYVGLTATFTPAANLASNTLYTASVTSGARDLAGNALSSAFTWSFTTGTAPDTTAPTVTLTDPAHNATGVAINKRIAATFSEVMDPLTIHTSSFTLTGPGGAPVLGTVVYTGLVATFTPNANLAGNTTYRATITTAARDLAGNPLATNFQWSFTTGAGADTVAPTVTATDPGSNATGVPTNQKVAATFSEGMDPLTLNTLTFTLTGPGATPVTGIVTYVGQTATFTPTVNLAGNTLYTGTITTGAKDLAGNPLGANFVWTFTTGASPDVIAPFVTMTNPADGSTNVPVRPTVRATFSEPMDPATLTTATFTLAGTSLVLGTVTYDAVNRTVTFIPTNDLAANTLHTATITTGARDLAGNPLGANFTWTFTTSPVALGAIAPFGSFGGGAGITNQGILTVVNGDIGTTGANTVITGFHDSGGNVYTETPLNIGTVNGTIFTATAPQGSTNATQGGLDANQAFLNLAALPGGIDLGTNQLGGLTLRPGVYKSAPGSYLITGSDLTLDAQGDPNATWVFQMASTLTVGGPGAAFPRNVILANGASAKNVFWQVGTAATVNAGGGGTMVGTIIASSGVTISTAGSLILSTLNGRAIGLNASVTMVNTQVNVPGP